jgi:hypothetical protein
MGNAVFRDPTGRRAMSLKVIGWFMAISIAIVVIYVVGDYVVAQPSADEGQSTRLASLFRPDARLSVSGTGYLPEEPPNATTMVTSAVSEGGRDQGPAALSALTGERPLSIAFYANEDAASFSALDRAPHLDWVVPAWLSMSGPTMEVAVDTDRKLTDKINVANRSVSILPMIQNLGSTGWQGDGLAHLLANKGHRPERLATIVKALEEMGAAGLVLACSSWPMTSIGLRESPAASPAKAGLRKRSPHA